MACFIKGQVKQTCFNLYEEHTCKAALAVYRRLERVEKDRRGEKANALLLTTGSSPAAVSSGVSMTYGQNIHLNSNSTKPLMLCGLDMLH